MSVRGLSCYTSNLHRYLDAEWDGDAFIARSVRLAARVDLGDGGMAFSHHAPGLDRLPDGSRLAYSAAESPGVALPALTAELDRYGRVLVVVDSTRLPWSVAQGCPATPHWLLVEGTGEAGWRVRDEFSALLPAGMQLPYEGTLTTPELCDAMKLPDRWSPEQDRRNALAFGGEVTVPRYPALWLQRAADTRVPPSAVGHWLTGDEAVLTYLIGRGPDDAMTAHFEDIWAAAGHRVFAYRWRLAGAPTEAERPALRMALAAWENLPRLLRFAVECAERGRPRRGLITTTLLALLSVERELACAFSTTDSAPSTAGSAPRCGDNLATSPWRPARSG
jgi:hypothetical protein